MLMSMRNTSTEADVVFCIDEDDPFLEEYIIFFGKTTPYTIQKRIFTTQRINAVFNLLPSYEFYSVTNDDFVYHTKRWDRYLQSDGIAYGDDLFLRDQLPTTSVINGEIIRALGWLQLPTLHHLFGDTVWCSIGKEINRLYYFPNVIIEHKHFLNQKASPDTYHETNSNAMYKIDAAHYVYWYQRQRDEDVEKIKRRINGTKN